MARYNDYGGFPPYVPVAERRVRAEKMIAKLRKRNPAVAPIVVEGRKLIKTWWGDAWSRNLERYADFMNRMPRGRSYVRHGAVLDLQITAGKIEALVLGSDPNPYRIAIHIDPLSPDIWDAIIQACEGSINSLQELLEGKFPKALNELFTAQGGGLFPAPEQIHMECSCPDWATVCKHVSATLYGVGVRLDESPRLFFELREVHVEELVTRAITEKSDALLKKAGQKSGRVIENAEDDLEALFGIDLEDEQHKLK